MRYLPFVGASEKRSKSASSSQAQRPARPVRYGKTVVWLLAGDGSWARAEEGTAKVHQSGALRLWEDLERVGARWEEAGHFSLNDLTVELTPETTSVTSPDGEWTIHL
jgi:hypothetical protein